MLNFGMSVCGARDQQVGYRFKYVCPECGTFIAADEKDRYTCGECDIEMREVTDGNSN